MIKEINIDTDWLTRQTGDPFADVGGLVVEYLQERRANNVILDHIKEATNIYVNKWENNLHAFFLNSTITHNSNKGQKGIEKTIGFFKGLLEGNGGEEGFCRITGQLGKVYNGARDNHIMSGSSTLINFHHGFESGLRLSKEALIRMFFVPLGVEQLGDKVAVLSSNSLVVTRFFVRQNVDRNLKDLGHGISNSIQKSAFSNPANAIFEYARQCIENVKSATLDEEMGISYTEGITLNLFHFTNFGASPTISIYTLPATVFAFYARCLRDYRRDWENFVFRYYGSSKFKNAEFNEISQKWIGDKKDAEYEDFKTWKNQVLENLLYGKSILSQFLKHSKKNKIDFAVIELYQINLQNMDKRALNKIKELSDFIVNDRSEDEIKKAMTKLNKAKNGGELRYFLIKQLSKNYEEGNSKPLFLIDEYVEYLFPDSSYWKEVRDLLLIAIYQKLHETNMKIDNPLQEEEEDS
jgi:CRISPR-associated protein Cst1